LKQSRVGGVILGKMILITCLAAMLAATAPQKPQSNDQGNGTTANNPSNRRSAGNAKKKAEPKPEAKKAAVPADPEPLVKMSLDAGIEAANAALKAAQEEIARLQAIGSDGKSEPAGAALKVGAEAAVAGAAAVQKELSKERKKPAPDGEKKEQPEKPTSEKKPEPRKPEQKKDNPFGEKKKEA